jgi:hypothetical protein
MQNTTFLAYVAAITDALMLITIFSFWSVLVRARREGPQPLAIAAPLFAALGWAALWVWWPPLAVARLASPPGGQVIAIATTVLGLMALLTLSSVQTYFRTSDVHQFVRLGPWRIVYGALLLTMGALGGLPDAFFWSAGIGDILVGIWAIAILTRKSPANERELVAWNLVGVADLLHVLVLGAINLRPFFLGHPDIVPPLNLLPLVGVPLFIALHVMTLWGLMRRSPKVRA